jgi:hemoglobin
MTGIVKSDFSGERQNMMNPAVNVYEMVGGSETFRQLVNLFYDKLERDEELRAIFPADLTDGREWQYLFLVQYWGGPAEYSEMRGHPRLRMRHAPYAITPELRDRWVRCMLEAIDEVNIQEPARQLMRDYFERGASFMINQD